MSTTTLLIALFFLIFLSGYFSMAETGIMAINRYRLRHLTQENNPKAKRVSKLLEHPEKLLGVILLGNNLANILASSITTLLAEKMWGTTGVLFSTLLLTGIILVFSEITPKVFAASHPQQTAFSMSLTLTWVSKILYPFVFFLNLIVKGIFKLLRITIKKNVIENLSREELHTLVREAGSLLLLEHQNILIKALDLQKTTVNDIMVPNHEVHGIDLNDDWDTVLEKIMHSAHPRLPVYHHNIDQLEGVLHVRKIISVLEEEKFNKESLLSLIEKPYFLPEETPLLTQLINFRQHKYRIGFIVDEYGEIQGLITLEDILEELVGEFTTNLFDITSKDIFPQSDGSFIVDGSVNVRELNRLMDWNLPTSQGPKTLSGLIIEHLEMIPPSGISLLISNYPIEVVQVKDNMIKTARIFKKRS